MKLKSDLNNEYQTMVNQLSKRERISALILLNTAVVLFSSVAYAAPTFKVSQYQWGEFTSSEKESIRKKVPHLEVIPSSEVGTILSAQVVDFSTQGTESGAALGSTVGQAVYVDKAIQSSNYSATTQLGAAVLGAAIGSTIDSNPVRRYVLNYGLKTVDGEVVEVKVVTTEQFTRPVGQCVSIPAVVPVPNSLCSSQTVKLLRDLLNASLPSMPDGASPESVTQMRGKPRPSQLAA